MLKLIKITQESQLLWKNQATSLGSILFLLNSCKTHKQLLTIECVNLFVDSLVHENINVRRIALDGLVVILKMVKHKKKTRTVAINDLLASLGLDSNKIAVNRCEPGYRVDNGWHVYDPKFVDCETKNVSQEERTRWNQAKFLDKSYWGYYCWPSKLKLNENERNVYAIDESIGSNKNSVIIGHLVLTLKRIQKV
jgi:hypothetical protein